MASPETFVTTSEQETFALAEKLVRTLQPGTFVLLHGDLGAGKTAFVRGLASGLGLDPAEVSSPTFVLIQHYRGAVPLTHVDLYRLDNAAAVDDLGLEELAAGGVLAVEWAERLPRAIDGSVSVHIEDAGGNTRYIQIKGSDPFIRCGSLGPLS
ncbi:MAG TPA: tRNA (adenosine(37)-N6)-threonylcarbamoyltransferase complex ATPase subunit type 1 TsaE [Vicinamibacterales bacterium]|nr:tRNA (adenosine(37)-N6)-threonylcarbamoyltransferase complex ATPase subunit type 1 TsaE [Vicinamibacterales bacterium]